MSDSPNFNSKQELMLNSLKVFFSSEDAINIMTPIVEGSSDISLRLMDWFVTNYSKKKNVYYALTNTDGNVCHFFVYLNYKAQLKAYSKKQFDPFCRRHRIRFYYKNDKFFITTIGQLNFFRWAINYKIIDYIRENRTTIEKDMNDAIKHAYGNSKKTSTLTNTDSDSLSSSSGRKKRQELSESATKKINKTNVQVVISFD